MHGFLQLSGQESRIATKFSNETLRIHNRLLGYYPPMKINNIVLRIEYWMKETLPALERIMVGLGLFAKFAVDLVTLVIRLLKHH